MAHPLFRVNDQLTIEHFEKLLLLFNRFEGINGTRDPRASELVRLILSNLTPDMMADMADRHGIDPWGDEPCKKHFTAGSDDHSGVYIASVHDHARRRVGRATPRSAPRGQPRNGWQLGHEPPTWRTASIIAYGFYKSQLLGGSLARKNLIDDLFRRVLEGKATSQPLSFRDKLRYFARRVTSRARGVQASEERPVR